jgi:hypothetical protein
VASHFFRDEVQYTFPEERLIEHIERCCELFEIPSSEARNVLGEIERHHGILERFSADSFMFSHPSFQEYFVARSLVAKRQELPALKANFHDERWSSVIEFMVALHADPSDMLQVLVSNSDLSSVKYFPPMARRTRVLWLLYRCLCAGAAVPREFRRSLYRHIAESHLHMSKAFINGGVFPAAVLMGDGVRHVYVYFNRRDTLHEALQPLRLLANEILLSPSEDYSDLAIALTNDLVLEGGFRDVLANATTALCLAVPVAQARPAEVAKLLRQVRESGPAPGYLKRIAEESLQVLQQTDGE